MVDKTVIQNRKARFDYEIEDTCEAGLALTGCEVKSLRQGQASLQDSFAGERSGEMYLYNMHISPYREGSRSNSDPKRTRKLLLHKREIRKMTVKLAQKNYTLVPLRVYFKKSYAKVELGLGRGRKKYDKRTKIEEKRMQREVERALKYNSKF